MLDAAAAAAFVDDGNLQRVRTVGVAEDESGVLLEGCLGRHRRLHLAIDLTVDQPALVVDEAVRERELDIRSP